MDSNWKNCLIDYLKSLRSPTTRISYSTILIRFFSEHDPHEVTKRAIEAFMRTPYPDPHRKEQGELAVATQNQRVAAIASLYKFASSYVPEGETEPLWNKANPTIGIVRGIAAHTPQGLTLDELERLFSLISTTSEIGIRDRALLLFYLHSARRRSEIAELRYGDIRPATFQDGKGGQRQGWIYFFRNKGSKSVRDSAELVPIVKEAIDWYLLASGRIETIQPADPLFVATTGVRRGDVHPLSAHAIAQRMSLYAKQAHLSASLHTLRHSAAKLRHESGQDIISLMELLRHRNMHTTWLYLQGLTGTEDKGARLLGDKLERL